jgi:hypothetical protein
MGPIFTNVQAMQTLRNLTHLEMTDKKGAFQVCEAKNESWGS